MNTSLLSCLRLAGERLQPALAAEEKKRPIRFKIFRPIRILSGLSIMPLRIPRQTRVYIHGRASATGKSGIALRELNDAGLPNDVIYVKRCAANPLVTRALRTLIRLPAALIILMKLKKRTKKLKLIDYQITVGREIVRLKLKSRPLLSPLIISDVSPDLNILWSAAASTGNRALWWQDDFHHYGSLPYDIKGAAVLNVPGINSARNRSDKARIAVRRGRDPIPVKKVPENPIVGIATSNWFSADADQIHRLGSVVRSFGADSAHLRLHPNSPVVKSHADFSRIIISDRDETMAEFAERIDVCVVGNSAAQIWLVRNGVPAVHIPGLDTNGYDLYGYVSSGFVLGVTDIELLSIDRVNDFYVGNRKTHSKKIRDYTVLDSDHADVSLYDLCMAQS